MGDRRAESALRDIDALFRLGVASGMSDGQLLERFAAQSDTDGQMAFEAIVRRHGPMVLGVCHAHAGRLPRRRGRVSGHVHGTRGQVTGYSQARVAGSVAARGRGANIPPAACRGPAWPGTADPCGGARRPGRARSRLGRVGYGHRRRAGPASGQVPAACCSLLPRGPDAGRGGPDTGVDEGDCIGPAGPCQRPAAPSSDAPRAGSDGRGADRVADVAIGKAAVPPPLLVPTVRAATAAILGGAEPAWLPARWPRWPARRSTSCCWGGSAGWPVRSFCSGSGRLRSRLRCSCPAYRCLR